MVEYQRVETLKKNFCAKLYIFSPLAMDIWIFVHSLLFNMHCFQRTLERANGFSLLMAVVDRKQTVYCHNFSPTLLLSLSLTHKHSHTQTTRTFGSITFKAASFYWIETFVKNYSIYLFERFR